jgi:hypothetical protein
MENISFSFQEFTQINAELESFNQALIAVVFKNEHVSFSDQIIAQICDCYNPKYVVLENDVSLKSRSLTKQRGHSVVLVEQFWN